VELRHLRYFVAVAEELHFGRAAVRLHISQPPLSHQIQNLERELGVELLRRTKRSVNLTAAGQLFLEQARRVLQNADHAVEVAQRADRGQIESLSIGFGPTPEGGLLREVLKIFLSRCPDVRMELHSLYTQEQVDALAKRQIQVAFPLLPIPMRGLIVETLERVPLSVALPADHTLASRQRIALSDLREEPFVLVSRAIGPSFYDLVFSACRQAGFTPKVRHETTHVYTVLGFVAAGFGVSIVPEPIGLTPREGVVYRPLRAPAPTAELGLAYRREDSSKTLATFLDVVRETARQRRRGDVVRLQEAKSRPARVLRRATTPERVHLARSLRPVSRYPNA
jgi:DNA-binding transcriptional LysR family regulator